MSHIVPRLAVGAAALLTIGVIPPTSASADPEVPSGPYDVAANADDGSHRTGSWNFTPCGPSCTAANGADAGAPHNWQFRLSNGRWTFNGPDQTDCLGGRQMDRTINASFDAATLAGDWSGTQMNACGPFPAGTPLGPWHFQLTKAG